MSDVIVVSERITNNVPYEKQVTVHEHRAPTDQSIHLYHQMIEKARNELVESYVLKGSAVGEIAVAVFKNVAIFPDNLTVVYKFKLNDKQYKGQFMIDESKLSDVDDHVYQFFVQSMILTLDQHVSSELNRYVREQKYRR